MEPHDFIVSRSRPHRWQTTRRTGLREIRLLTAAQSAQQNLVLLKADQGARVEPHRVENSESIFVIQGTFEVSSPRSTQVIGPGDLCYFPPGSSHGLRCLESPGQFLAVFAPAAGAR
jgi:quercetin dioxygenase-like cupin family protein